MRRAALAVLLLLAASPGTALAAPSDRLVVLMHQDAGRTPQAVAARASGPRAPQIGMVTVSPRPGETPQQAARRLRADPAVASVQPEGRMRLRYLPNDPALSSPELAPRTPGGTVQEWWASPMGLPAAWDVTRGDGALVAIIDTGADGGHPELSGKIRDTLDLDETFGAGPPTTDENGHGTHVASLACAQPNNGVGIAGAGLIDFNQGGQLSLAATSTWSGQFTGSGTIVVGAGTTLTLGSNIYAPNVNIILAGGTLNFSGGNHVFGNLTVTGNSTLDFAGASTFEIQNLFFNSLAHILNVVNWTDGVDYFLSRDTPGVRHAPPLNQVVFTGWTGDNTTYLPDTQITPVPEPSTYRAMLMGAGLAFFGYRRWRRERQQRAEAAVATSSASPQ